MNRLTSLLRGAGMLALAGVLLLVLILMVDRLVLPAFTRLGHENATPDLVGMDVEAARQRARELGFQLVVERRKADPAGRFQRDQVMEQFPRAQRLTKQGRRIYVSLCEGGRYVEVPDCRGLSLRQALGRLADRGLGLDSTRLSFRFDSLAGHNAILSQHPPAGDSLLPGSKLGFAISLGPAPASVEVPSLLGLSSGAARQALQQHGLSLGKVSLLLEPERSPGLRRQQPAAGRQVAPGTAIDVWINAEPEP